MTEREYINVGDLKNIKIAKYAIWDIVSNSSKIIENEKHSQIMQWLSEWEMELFEVIKVK